MKRRIVALIVASAGLGVSGCSNDADPSRAANPPSAALAWDQPPRIDGVVRQGEAVIVRGTAGPGSRVVLRGMDGSATAAAADGQGRFEIRLAVPAGDVLLTPEVQNGEVGAPSPERLVILTGGPIALLSPGEPARRLDPAGPLDAVDADGLVMVLGGRVAGAQPAVTIDGAAMPVTASRAGRWRLTANAVGAAPITVNGRDYLFPGAGAQASGAGGFGVTRAGSGWRVDWSIPPSARQSTWLPDA